MSDPLIPMTGEQASGRQKLANLVVELTREIEAAESQLRVLRKTVDGYRRRRDEAAVVLATIDQKFGAETA